MPNHWHLVLWPRSDGELSDFAHWLTLTHTQRWHAHHHDVGCGHLYQGRYKSCPIAEDDHYLTLMRYVERNALRAGLVGCAEAWAWCSLAERLRSANECGTAKRVGRRSALVRCRCRALGCVTSTSRKAKRSWSRLDDACKEGNHSDPNGGPNDGGSHEPREHRLARGVDRESRPTLPDQGS